MDDDNDKLWALRDAATPQGFTPHTRGMASMAQSLEREGLLLQELRGPVWGITDKGRAELERLEALTS